MRKHGLLVLALWIGLPASSQPPVTESMGSYHSPEQRALEAYARGIKLKRKAEAEKDPDKQAQLYLKAKEELSKSVGYHAHYDGYVALGQVYLVLGRKDSAFDACYRAQALKPNDETARSCIEQALAAKALPR